MRVNAGKGRGEGLGVAEGFSGGVSSGDGDVGAGVGAGTGVVTGTQAPSNTDNIRNTPANIQALWFLMNMALNYELPSGSIITIGGSSVNYCSLPLPLSFLMNILAFYYLVTQIEERL